VRRLLAVAASPLLVWAAVSVAVGDPDYALRALGAATDTPAAASSADDGMGKPAGSAWGASGEKVPLPTAPAVAGIPWFQDLVNQAPEGSVLKVPAGSYSGPVVVNKPLTIEAQGQVIIDGGGKGTVFVLDTSGAVLRGVHLTNSGGSHDSDDACLNVRGDRNVVDQVRITNCLFGIDLKQSNDNKLTLNYIRSKPFDLGLRGDGVRLWYSKNNLLEGNEIEDSRDMVAWYSDHNVFRNNVSRRSRYSIHFMFAHENTVEGNRFYDNAVGVYLMYTNGAYIRNNTISHATGATGMAVGLKEASNTVIEGNEILYCSTGIGTDLSPFEPGSKTEVRKNRFAFNGIAVSFVSDREGSVFESNVFEGNLADVAVAGEGGAAHNRWHGNYWDGYQGFDRNNDGVGDTPYEDYAYADRLWMEVPFALFFKSAPMMESLDFLERLAPFSDPVLMVRDEAPVFKNPRRKAP